MLLEKEIARLEAYIPQAQLADQKISREGIGWHIHHSLKVIHSVLKTLETSDPAKYRPKFNLSREIFLNLGWFPRGSAKAPKVALPPEIITTEGIMEELEAVRERLYVLESYPENSYFRHPYFGHLNIAKSKHFLAVHTRHHLKIIADIAKG